MNWDIGVISVIFTGLVALSSTLIPLLIQMVKWNQERKTSELQKIDQRTIELLESLSLFKSADVNPENLLEIKSIYGQLLSRYYAWESVVWPRCKDMDRAHFTYLRSVLEPGFYYKPLFEETPKVAHEIMSLSQHATERVL